MCGCIRFPIERIFKTHFQAMIDKINDEKHIEILESRALTVAGIY